MQSKKRSRVQPHLWGASSKTLLVPTLELTKRTFFSDSGQKIGKSRLKKLLIKYISVPLMLGANLMESAAWSSRVTMSTRVHSSMVVHLDMVVSLNHPATTSKGSIVSMRETEKEHWLTRTVISSMVSGETEAMSKTIRLSQRKRYPQRWSLNLQMPE